MSDVRLYLNHLPDYDWLIALEFGRIDDGQPADTWRGVSEHIGFLLDAPGGREVGFKITSLSTFDDEARDLEQVWDGPRFHVPQLGLNAATVGFKITSLSTFDEEARDLDEVWDGPRFHVPQLGLNAATVGETVLAARALFGDEPTINRVYFSAGVNADGQEALAHWLSCLEAGDCMAHFALGYTLYDLGRFHEAYRHLRYYAELAPAGSWNWCWYGKAAQAIGELDEARVAYKRALALEPYDQETDAAELLEELDDEEEDD